MVGRTAVIPLEKKVRAVLSVLAGNMQAEVARREGISEQSIVRWKNEFIEGGTAAVAEGRGGVSRIRQLENRVEDLTMALGEAHLEIREWRRTLKGAAPPSPSPGNAPEDADAESGEDEAE